MGATDAFGSEGAVTCQCTNGMDGNVERVWEEAFEATFNML